MRVYNLVPGSEVAGRECAFCGDTLQTGDQVIECPVCRTFHHTECWRFGGNKCARLGCTGHGALAGAKTAPLLQSPVTTASQVIRIQPSDIARTMRAAPRRVAGASAATAGIWGNAPGSIVLSAVLSLLLSLVYRFVGTGLNWAMGAQRFQDTFALEYLYSIGHYGLEWWVLGGAIYGLFHHRFLTGKDRGFYQLVRFVTLLLYLGSLTYQLGYLMFTPGYRWPTIIWELPSKVLWLAPLAAWGLVVVTGAMAVSTYTSKLTVFEGTIGIVALLIVMTLSAYSNALGGGLTCGGIGWLLGTVIDLVWGGIVWVVNTAADLGWRGCDFSTSWLYGGIAIGGSIGFIGGLFAQFGRTES